MDFDPLMFSGPGYRPADFKKIQTLVKRQPADLYEEKKEWKK